MGTRLASRALALYGWLHRLGERGWASSAIFSWSFLQGALIPGPVDGLIIPFALTDPPKAWRFAWAAVAGSVLGTLIAYSIGVFAYGTIGHVILGWAGVGPEEVERMRRLFAEKGWWLVMISTWTPMSIKLTSITAGAFGLPWWQFVMAIFLGRGVRFFSVALVCRFFGDRVEGWVLRQGKVN